MIKVSELANLTANSNEEVIASTLAEHSDYYLNYEDVFVRLPKKDNGDPLFSFATMVKYIRYYERQGFLNVVCINKKKHFNWRGTR